MFTASHRPLETSYEPTQTLNFDFQTLNFGHFDPKILKFHHIKSPIFGVFLDANGQCQVVYLLKKITQKFSVVVSKFENDPLTSLNGKT